MLFNKEIRLFSVCFFSFLILGPASFLAAQIESSDAAGKYVLDKYSEIINNYVVTGTEMTADIVKVYDEDIVKSRDIKRYRNSMAEDAKLKLNMIRAILDYYSGDTNSAVKSAYRVVTAAPDNTELKDCAIFLAYMSKEYTYLKRIVSKDEPGSAVIGAMEASNNKLASKVNAEMAAMAKAAEIAKGYANMVKGRSNDPNSLPLEPLDPNSAAGRAAAARQKNTTPTQPAPTRGGERTIMHRTGRNLGNARRTGIAPRGAVMDTQPTVAAQLELDITSLPVEMLGKELGKLSLQSINGSYTMYDPTAGKALCLVLWGVEDPETMAQVNSVRKLFTSTGGGFGPVQYVGVNCNSSDQVQALKVVFDEVVNYPALWPQCIMTPTNKEQLADIDPVSGVVLIAGTDGTVRYVGPADNVIARSIISQEAKSVAGDMAAFMNSTPVTVPAMIIPSELKSQLKAKVVKTKEPEVVPYKEDEPVKVDMVDDPTIIQAQQKLELARTKSKIQFGISFKSALDLCDEIMEKWPGTQEADEAKKIIEDICSKYAAQVYVKQRIRDGKYVGEENER